MSAFLDNLYKRAAAAKKTIVLAEGFDGRVVKAAEIATRKGIAKIVLLGIESEIIKNNPDVDLEGITIINPSSSDKIYVYAETLYQLRKDKGMTEEQAVELVKNNPLYFGAVALKVDDVDGMVGGASFSSADVLRTALQVVRPAPGIKSVSSCFVMVMPENSGLTDAQAMIFADCAVIPEPDSCQLADIALAAAQSAASIIEIEPKIAMLSFSTKGSAKHERVDKVRRAVEIVKAARPDLKIDGDLQLDAALVPSVGKQKAPLSQVAGYSNTLVFPNLESGNIGYKLAQRFGGCMAIGPIMQGLDKPINDLSRGCVAEDVVAAVAIAALQSVK